MIQTSCSELLVDTAIDDPQKAFDTFSALFKELGWDCSPPLTLKGLEKLKDEDGDENSSIHDSEIMVFDADGNRAFIQYGDNGYITTGYRFDSNCNHGDTTCYPIFKAAIDKLQGKLHSCDGGTTYGFEVWEEERVLVTTPQDQLPLLIGVFKNPEMINLLDRRIRGEDITDALSNKFE